MEKAFLTSAALRNANGGTMTIKLWTSLIPGDLPSHAGSVSWSCFS